MRPPLSAFPPPDRPISAVLVDAQVLYRDALMGALDEGFAWLGAAGDGREGLELLERLQPDLLVLDVHLSGIDGISLAGRLHVVSPETRILFLTDLSGGDVILQAFAAGATGFVAKSEPTDGLREAMVKTARDEPVLSVTLVPALLAALRSRGDTVAHLSPRELTVLEGLADGRSAGAMAEALSLALPTIKTHIQMVYAKLGVNDRAAAVAEGLRRGLIS